MKLPRTFVIVLASFTLAILTGCGMSGGGNRRPRTPPPPPTGTNYTTCNGQQVPNWLFSKFQSNYEPAIQAFVSHYDSNPNVVYMRIGLGRGGEINLPEGWNNQNSGSCFGGYSNTWGYSVGGNTANSSTWNNYLATMINFEGNLNSSKMLLVSITPVSGAGTVTDDFIAPIAVQNGLSFGNQGLEASDITDYPDCGGDWCNLFASHPPAIKELQTIGQSCPTGTACANQQAADTGPLPPLLPFATLHGANDLELYYQDWLIAYDPAYASSVGVDSTQAAQYQAAIHAAALAGAKMQVLFPPQASDVDYQAVHDFLMSNPDVTGAVISAEWSDFDIGTSDNTAHSTYDFSITDGIMQPWIQAGKKINLVLQDTTYGGGGSCPLTGIGSHGSAGNNCAVPPYMWNVLK